MSEIAIIAAFLLVVVGWSATGALIKKLKCHYPELYTRLGKPMRWLPWQTDRSLRPRRSIKEFRNFLLHLEFRQLERVDVRVLGWVAVISSVLGFVMFLVTLVSV